MERVCHFFGIVMVLLFAFATSSCMVMRTAEKGYHPVRLVQAGTAFEAVMVPEGAGASLALSAMVVAAGSVNVYGPYRLQITAFGRAGQHRGFEIREVRVRSAKGEAFTLSRDTIGGSAYFAAGEYLGEVRSVRTVRGIITWKPEDHGTVTVEADVVLRIGREYRPTTVTFVFVPSDTVKVESVNVPWEIKRAIWKEGRELPISAWRASPP